MKNNLLLIGALLIAAALVLGCTGTQTIPGNQSHSLGEYLQLSNTVDLVYEVDLDVELDGEKISTGTFKNSQYDSVLRQIVEYNDTASTFIYKDDVGIMCFYNEYLEIICFKLFENTTDFMKRGMAFDRELLSRSYSTTYLGTETHDSVATDCFKVIPHEDYIADNFKELGLMGKFTGGTAKFCYGTEDGMVRHMEATLTFNDKIAQKEIPIKTVADITVLRESQKKDIESPASFALGGVDCFGEDTVDIELISMTEESLVLDLEGYVFDNKTITLNDYLTVEEETHDVTDIDLYDFAYIEGYPIGTICDGSEDYCLFIFCD